MMSASSKLGVAELVERGPHDFILTADVDDTLVPIREHLEPIRAEGLAGLDKLQRALRMAPHLVGLGVATGNSLGALDAYDQIPEFDAFIDIATFKITSVGTVIHHRRGNEFERDTTWPPQTEGWNPEKIRELMKDRPELDDQPPEAQNEHKVSYWVAGVPDAEHESYIAELEGLLTPKRIAAQVIFSSGLFLDFLPIGVHKGSANEHVIDTVEAETGRRQLSIATGNSWNDGEFLEAADFAILPSNADTDFRDWAISSFSERLYVAREGFAGGVLEGLQYASRAGLINFPEAT